MFIGRRQSPLVSMATMTQQHVHHSIHFNHAPKGTFWSQGLISPTILPTDVTSQGKTWVGLRVLRPWIG